MRAAALASASRTPTVPSKAGGELLAQDGVDLGALRDGQAVLGGAELLGEDLSARGPA